MSNDLKRYNPPEEVKHWIGGQLCSTESGNTFDDINPLDDSVYAQVTHGTAEDVGNAVNAAAQAFESYRDTVVGQREEMLNRAAELLEKHRNEFIDILIDEIGSPLIKANWEVGATIEVLRAAAGIARHVTGMTFPFAQKERLSFSLREPLGVVAAITPFNIPLLKGIKQTANALALGNTVVLLPSELAPVMSARIAKLYEEAGLPSGAFNIVFGYGHEIGDALTKNPLVRSVSFTGSCQVGRHIQALCGSHNKRVVLELGGKNPMVLLKDADLKAAIPGAIMGMFAFQGQICMGASRIIVERPLLQPFLGAYSNAVKGLGMGDLRSPSTIIGPIISGRQRERIRDHIEDARAKGATVVTGGDWEDNRCQPTILTDVTPDMTVYGEETFGPVTSIYAVDSAEEALKLANDTNYGLSAAIYTADLNNAFDFVRKVKSGMAHVNAPPLYDEPHVPFGGVGDSGFGREGTDRDIENLTETKVITLQLGTPEPFVRPGSPK